MGEAEWKRIVESWSQSSLSLQEFFGREELALASFWRWGRRVWRGEKPGAFVEITQGAAVARDAPGWQVEIEFPSDAVLRFRA